MVNLECSGTSEAGPPSSGGRFPIRSVPDGTWFTEDCCFQNHSLNFFLGSLLRDEVRSDRGLSLGVSVAEEGRWCDTNPFCLGKAASAMSEKVRTRLEELDDFEEVSTSPASPGPSGALAAPAGRAQPWWLLCGDVAGRAPCSVLPRHQRIRERRQRCRWPAHGSPPRAALLKASFLTVMPEQTRSSGDRVSLDRPPPWDAQHKGPPPCCRGLPHVFQTRASCANSYT